MIKPSKLAVHCYTRLMVFTEIRRWELNAFTCANKKTLIKAQRNSHRIKVVTFAVGTHGQPFHREGPISVALFNMRRNIALVDVKRNIIY